MMLSVRDIGDNEQDQDFRGVHGEIIQVGLNRVSEIEWTGLVGISISNNLTIVFTRTSSGPRYYYKA